MAEIATIARPYARAAFEHARAAKALPRWSELLARSAATVADSRVGPLLDSPHVTPEALAEFVIGIAGDAGEDGGNFLRLLAQNRRLEALPEITAQFEQLRADVERTVDVEIATAMALTPEQVKKLSAALEKRLARSVRVQPVVDANLVGGARVRAGDFVIDGTLRGKLERLAGAMTN